MRLSWKTEVPLLVLIAGMFVAAWSTWPIAPDRIPIHWNIHGEPDGYGGRFMGLLLPPLIALSAYMLMLFLPRLDPGRPNYERFVGAYWVIRASVVAFMAVVDAITLAVVHGLAVDVPRTVGLSIGIVFIILGNVLGKVRPNWFVGVRTPWTLSSKRSWTRTHRFAGWVFIAGGLAFMVAAAVHPVALVVACVVFFGGILATVVYSYLVWKGDPDRVPPAGTVPSNGD